MKTYVLVDFNTEECEMVKNVISVDQNGVVDGEKYILVEIQVHPDLTKKMALSRKRYRLLPIRRKES